MNDVNNPISATDTESSEVPANTTAKGDSFRDAVASLFRTQFSVVTVEKRLSNGKKADIVFEREDFGRNCETAVECKDYGRPLTATDIREKIISHYQAPLNNGEISSLIIVARHPLGADARSEVASNSSVRFQTYEELEQSLIGLGAYVRDLELSFRKEDVSHYYVETRLDKHAAAALDVVESWLEDDQAPSALAVLGGYGMGKTSFATRLASAQASRYLKDPGLRIPILLRLGSIVHETSLEAMFGKEFTARYPTPHFNFNTLTKLNSDGRLLIILDGFDEMKHAMSAYEFRANFREINRLVVPKARVTMLDRPSALPSEERELVFRGLKRWSSGHVQVDPNWPIWREERIAFFSDSEVANFLKRYLSIHSPTATSSWIDNRIIEIVRHVQAELLRRPVQCRLVAELASNADTDLQGITLFDLYDRFIQQLIARDAEKKARHGIPEKDRATFQRALAWWAWSGRNKMQGAFRRDEVPGSLLKDLPHGGAEDEEAKFNEYVVSSVTDEKESGVLFFAHRSFQEFLVADYLRRQVPSADQHGEYAAAISPEIGQFLLLADDQSFWRDWVGTIDTARGPLSLFYLGLFAKSEDVVREIRSRMRAEEATAAQVGILHGAQKAGSKGFDAEEKTKLFLRITESADPLPAGLAAFLLMGGATNEVLYRRLLTALLNRALRFADPFQAKDRALLVSLRGEDPLLKALKDDLSRHRDESGGPPMLDWNAEKTATRLSRFLTVTTGFLEDDMIATMSLSQRSSHRESQVLDIFESDERRERLKLVFRASRSGIPIVFKEELKRRS